MRFALFPFDQSPVPPMRPFAAGMLVTALAGCSKRSSECDQLVKEIVESQHRLVERQGPEMPDSDPRGPALLKQRGDEVKAIRITDETLAREKNAFATACSAEADAWIDLQKAISACADTKTRAEQEICFRRRESPAARNSAAHRATAEAEGAIHRTCGK